MASSALAQTYGPEVPLCWGANWASYSRIRVHFQAYNCGSDYDTNMSVNGQYAGSVGNGGCDSADVYVNGSSGVSLGWVYVGHSLNWPFIAPWSPRFYYGCNVDYEDTGNSPIEGTFTFYGQQVLPNISVGKSATPSTLKAGATGQYYTISVAISGGATSAPTYIYDTLPTGITTAGAITASGGSVLGCPGAGASNLSGCYIPSGTPAGTVRITVPVNVGNSTPSSVTNTAYAYNTQSANCTTTTRCPGSTTNPVTPSLVQLKIRQSINGYISGTGPWAFSYTGTNGVGSPTLTNNAVGAAGTVDSPTYTLSAAGVATSFTAASAPGWYINSAICADTNAAVSGNPTGNLATASGSAWGPYTLTIPAANVRGAAVIECQLSYSVNAVRLTTKLAGPRISDTDQFVVKVTDANLNDITSTTAGTGSTVTGGDTGWRTYNWGSHTIQQTMAPGSASPLSNYISTVSCTNAQAGGSNVSGVTKLGDSFTAADTDIITCTITNTPRPQLIIHQAINATVKSSGPWSFSYTGTNGVGSPTLTNNAVDWPNEARSPAYALTTTGAGVSITAALAPGWYMAGNNCMDTNAAVSGNPTGQLETASSNPWWGPRTLSIAGTNVRNGAVLECWVRYAPSAVRVITKLGGPRMNDSDQFVVKVTDANVSDITSTTAGTGSTVSGGDTGWRTYNWGGHTIQQTMAPGSVSPLSDYVSTVSCTNAQPGGVDVSGVTKIGDSYTSGDADIITCTITNTPKGRPKLRIGQVMTNNTPPPGPWAFSYTGTNGVGSPTLTNNGVDWGNAVTSPYYTLSTTGALASVTAASSPGWYIAWGSCTDTNTAVSGNPGGELAGASGGSWANYTLSIAGANVRSGAVIDCWVRYAASAVRLTTKLAGPRMSDTDQFIVKVTDGNLNDLTSTTAGTGSTLSGGDTGWRTYNWGSHTITQTMAPGSASTLSDYISTVSCTNANTAGANVSGVTKIGDSYTSGEGDIITCTITNTPKGRPQFRIRQYITGNVTSPGPWPFSYTGTNGVGSPTLTNTGVDYLVNTVNSPFYTLSTTGAAVSVTAALAPGWYMAGNNCTDTNAAVSGNPTSQLETASSNPWWGPRTLSIAGTYVRSGAVLECWVRYSPSGVRLITKIAGPRISDSDQFVVKVSDINVSDITSTTAGAGSTVTGGDTGLRTYNWGSHTITQTMAPGSTSALSDYTSSVSCTNAQVGGSNVSGVTKVGDSYTSGDADLITCTITNTPKPKLYIQQAINYLVKSPGPWSFAYTGTNGVGSPTLTNAAVDWTGAATSTNYLLSAQGTATTITAASAPGWYLSSAICTDTNAAISGNPTGNLATGSGSIFGPYTLTIPAANVRLGSVFQCRIVYSASAIRLITQMGGPRISDTDQFIAKVSDANINNITTTTAGTGSTVTGGDTGVRGYYVGSHTITQTMAPGSATPLSNYTSTVSCSNAQVGGTNVSGVTKIGDSYTSADTDIITCTITNTPRVAVLTLNKTIASRASSGDQFTVQIKQGSTITASATTAGTATTVSTGAINLNSGIAHTLNEVAAGTANLAQYGAALSCSNATAGSSTVLPTTLGGSFTPIAGDAITCTITNTPKVPTLTLNKTIASRVNSGDQFTVQIKQGSTITASATTAGTASSASTGATNLTAGTNYSLTEIAAGTTNLAQYGAALSCSNATAGSSTVLPTTLGGSVTPTYGDVITCTITNTPLMPTLTVSQSLSNNEHTYPVFVTYTGNNGWASRSLRNDTIGEVSSDTQTLVSPGIQMSFALNFPPGPWRINSLACTDSNAAVSGNPVGSFGRIQNRAAFVIDAANVRAGAKIKCALLLFAPAPF